MHEVDDIVEAFELLGDWDARYQYLVELGERMPPMDDALKTDGNRVQGCLSKVWIHANREPDRESHVRFDGDCDTPVIKGVVALLVGLLSGRTPGEVVALDVDELFERLQLAENLSPNRHFGIYAIVGLMKSQADRLEDTGYSAVG